MRLKTILLVLMTIFISLFVGVRNITYTPYSNISFH